MLDEHYDTNISVTTNNVSPESLAKLPADSVFPAVAVVGTPVETTPVDVPVDRPVDVPVETPVDTPVERPVETPVDTPVERPVETPVDTPVDTPGDAPVVAGAQALAVVFRAEHPAVNSTNEANGLEPEENPTGLVGRGWAGSAPLPKIYVPRW
jgi:hypothetical protein